MWLTLMLRYKKPLIWAAVVLAAVLTVYFWKKKSDSTKAIGNLTINKSNLTITNNQAIIIAENLLNAMDQWGTDDAVIISNLQTLRTDDLLLVMKLFGVKAYNGAGLATSTLGKLMFSNDMNLVGWLHQELSGDSLDQVTNIFRNAEIPF